jgi:hypothetical protein
VRGSKIVCTSKSQKVVFISFIEIKKNLVDFWLKNQSENKIKMGVFLFITRVFQFIDLFLASFYSNFE